MSSGIATAEIRLTQTKETLDKLRRIGRLVKDKYGERYDAMFDGQQIPFWVGQVRSLPQAWADGLADTLVICDTVCEHCKGKKSTIAGICFNCKGAGRIPDSFERPLFKILSRTDPIALNPQTYQDPPESPLADPEVEALTQ